MRNRWTITHASGITSIEGSASKAVRIAQDRGYKRAVIRPC